MAGITRKFEPTMHISNAHDVRQLLACGHCSEMGDRRYMVPVEGKTVHGGCALEMVGVDGIRALAPEDRGRITLGEIGVAAMKAIVTGDKTTER